MSYKITVLIVNDKPNHIQLCKKCLLLPPSFEDQLFDNGIENTNEINLLINKLVDDCFNIKDFQRVDLAESALNEIEFLDLAEIDVDFNDLDDTGLDSATIEREKTKTRGFDLWKPVIEKFPQSYIQVFSAQDPTISILQKAEEMGLRNGQNFTFDNKKDLQIIHFKMVSILKTVAQTLIWKLNTKDRDFLEETIKRNKNENDLLDIEVTINNQEMLIRHLLMCCAEAHYDAEKQAPAIKYNGVKETLRELLNNTGEAYTFTPAGEWAADYMQAALKQYQESINYGVWQTEVNDAAMQWCENYCRQYDYQREIPRKQWSLPFVFDRANSCSCDAYNASSILTDSVFRINFMNALKARKILLLMYYYYENDDGLYIDTLTDLVTAMKGITDLSLAKKFLSKKFINDLARNIVKAVYTLKKEDLKKTSIVQLLNTIAQNIVSFYIEKQVTQNTIIKLVECEEHKELIERIIQNIQKFKSAPFTLKAGYERVAKDVFYHAYSLETKSTTLKGFITTDLGVGHKETKLLLLNSFTEEEIKWAKETQDTLQ